MCPTFFLACCVAFAWPTLTAGFEIIDFGIDQQRLPYSEDGLNFTDLLGDSPVAVAGPAGNSKLIAATFDLPIYVRVEATVPFQLVAFDVDGLFRSWELRSSNGDVFEIGSLGTIPMLFEPGWQELQYFDIVHLPAEPNGTIWLDNIVVEYLPEPNSWVLWMVGVVMLRRS